MIAVFKPVNNWYWFDLREFKLRQSWKPSIYKWLKIEDYAWIIDELPIFKPKSKCKSIVEYWEQFWIYNRAKKLKLI